MQDIEWVRWGAFAFLGSIFLACAFANVQIVFGLGESMRRARAEGRNVSLIPFIGGLAGCAGFALSPSQTLRDLAWLPFLIDLWYPLIPIGILMAAWEGLFGQAEPIGASPQNAAEPPGQRAIVGCLLGTAVGDALGLASEGLSRRRQAQMVKRPDQYRLLFGFGMCSDDTEHACMLGQSLVVAGRPADIQAHASAFASDFARRLRFWLLGLPAGIGFATLRAILKLMLFFPPSRSGVFSAGNGPAMRSALLGVCFADDPARMLALVRASTRITHTDPKAEHAALAVALAASLAANGKTVSAREFHDLLKQHLGSEAHELLGLIERIGALMAQRAPIEAFADSIGCAKGVSGYALHTVPVALYAWLSHPADYRAAVLAAIRCGGDTDTVAAITGAIVGSGTGESGIPAAWLERLREWPRSTSWMRRLGARLAVTLQNGNPQAALPLSLFALFARNTIFIIVVLGHGFRRLLPPY